MRKKGLKKVVSFIIGSVLLVNMIPADAQAAKTSQVTKQTVKQAIKEDTETGNFTPTGGFQEKVVTYSEDELAKMPDFTTESDPTEFYASGSVEWNDASTGWNTAAKVTYGSTDYGYKQLTTAQKDIYTTILYATAGNDLDGSGECFMNSQSLNGAEGYQITYTGSSKDAIVAYCAFYEDHPEFYWLQSGYSISGSILVIAVDELYDTKAERTAIQNVITATGKERDVLVNAYNSSSDSWGKILSLHNQILGDVTYAYKGNSSTPETAIWAHSIVGVMTDTYVDSVGNHKVVCEGYAKTFQYILNMMGVDNVYVIGTAKGGGHAWNIVKVGNTWYNMDLTWDDGDDAVKYLYTAMPKSYFSPNHTPSTASSTIWLYDLPSTDDTVNLSNTYYGRHNAYATQSNCTNTTAFLTGAGVGSFDGDLYILCDTMNLVKQIAGVLGINTYYPASEYGKYLIFKQGGALAYQVAKPATDLSVDKTEVGIDIKNNKKVQLTYSTTTEGTDDYVRLSISDSTKISLDSSCVSLTNGIATVTVTGLRNGTTSIIAKPLVGSGAAVTTKVTVSGASVSRTLYREDSATTVVTEDDLTAYANGGKVKSGNVTTNYKTIDIYTSMETPSYSKGKGKIAKGKVIVGITSSADQPNVKNNKIVADKTAKNIASASIKAVKNSSNSKVTVTAKKYPGTVYLWVISVSTKDNIVETDYCPIHILAAPSTIKLYDIPDTNSSFQYGKTKEYKKQNVGIGENAIVYFYPNYKNSNKVVTKTTDATYTVSLDSKSKEYFEIISVHSTGTLNYFTVQAKKLKSGKKVTGTVNVICNENKKKASFKITALNHVKQISLVNPSGAVSVATNTAISNIGVSVSTTDKTTGTVQVSTVCNTSTEAMTDSPKIYAMGSADGYSSSDFTNGKIKITTKPDSAQKKIQAKLGKDKKSLTITTAKGTTRGTKAYFLLVYNTNSNKEGVKVICVTAE